MLISSGSGILVVTILLVITDCSMGVHSHSPELAKEDGKRAFRPATQKQNNLPRQSLSNLFFLDKTTGWLVRAGREDPDVIYGTADGGKTWSKLNDRDLRDSKGVIFADEENGWTIKDNWTTDARSNTVLRTTDGGRSWQKVLEIGTPIYTVDFPDQNFGYVSPRWLPVRRTTNGGDTWEESDSTEGVNYVFFLSDKEAWGYGSAIWHTNDGGNKWTKVVSPPRTAWDLYNAAFVKQTGIIIGSRNEVWRWSQDESWLPIKNLPERLEVLTSVSLVNSDEGWISGWVTVSEKHEGVLFHTDNGGRSWKTIARVPNELNDIRFLDPTEGWALGDDDILLHTTDGGTTWQKQIVGD